MNSARLEWAALALVLAVGAALRFYHLSFQSLWLDEAASVAFASGDIPYILRFTFTKEPNPPLYYLLLHFWILPFGASEIAVRSLSALSGVLSIFVLWAIGRRLFNRGVALVAGSVLALSPFHIWLSQEARAFALLSLFSLLALYSLLRALDGDRRRWWVAYGACVLAAMYLHLFGLLVLGAFVTMAPLLRRPERGWLRRLAAYTAVPVLLYVPWLLSLLNQFGEPQWRSRLGPGEIASQTLKTLPFGEAIVWDFAGRSWIVWAVLAVAPFALFVRRPALLVRPLAMLLWIAVPLGASFLISFVSPIFAPRYLIVIAPAYYLLIAVGVERVASRFWPVAPVTLAILAVTTFPVLNAVYTLPLKEDYRAAAWYLRDHARPDDAIVIMAGYIEYAFLYYGVDGETPLGDVTNAEQVPPALAPIADGHRRVWFVQSHYEIVDPGGHAERWLLGRCQKVGEQPVTGIRISELACTAPS